MELNDNQITRILFETNLNEKLNNPEFLSDITPLLSPKLLKSHSRPIALESDDGNILLEQGGYLLSEGWNLIDAANEVKSKIIANLH